MSTHLDQTIADLQEEVRLKESELIHTKRMVNSLCARAGRSLVYPDSELEQQKHIGSIRSDQFYGRPLAVCVREILEMRRLMNQGASPLDDIMSALKKGGYELGSISGDEDGQRRGVAISLAKNTAVFHRLPNGYFGLSVWYSDVKERKKAEEEEPRKSKPGPKKKAPKAESEELAQPA
jgi:hypothetical protein